MIIVSMSQKSRHGLADASYVLRVGTYHPMDKKKKTTRKIYHRSVSGEKPLQ